MAAPGPSPCTTLKRRADFLRAARALRHGAAGLMLQARPREDGEAAGTPIRIGYTCSKKLGNAVMRNRAKRRLRAAARAVLPAEGRPGWDYVLVGRPGTTVGRPFPDLLADLRSALARVHRTADRAANRTDPAIPEPPHARPETDGPKTGRPETNRPDTKRPDTKRPDTDLPQASGAGTTGAASAHRRPARPGHARTEPAGGTR